MDRWMLGGWMDRWLLGGWMQRKKRNVAEVNNQPKPARQLYIPTLNAFWWKRIAQTETNRTLVASFAQAFGSCVRAFGEVLPPVQIVDLPAGMTCQIPGPDCLHQQHAPIASRLGATGSQGHTFAGRFGNS